MYTRECMLILKYCGGWADVTYRRPHVISHYPPAYWTERRDFDTELLHQTGLLVNHQIIFFIIYHIHVYYLHVYFQYKRGTTMEIQDSISKSDYRRGQSLKLNQIGAHMVIYNLTSSSLSTVAASSYAGFIALQCPHPVKCIKLFQHNANMHDICVDYNTHT